MIRLLFIFLLTSVVSSAACAQVTYYLRPVGSEEREDVLGNNAALKNSELYEFMRTKWNVPTVEPIYKNGVIDNVEDLVPYEVIAVPELVTIYTSQVRGSPYDYNRQKHRPVGTLPVTVNPAENSIYIYAFNKDGKLIYPLVLNPDGDGKDYDSIYSIKMFQEHTNFTSFFRPIVSGDDIDILGTYDKNTPNKNPPNAITFRGRTIGRHSLTLAVRFNERFISVSAPDSVKALAGKIVTRTVEVNVIDGPETIDQLLFYASRNLGLQSPFELSFVLKEGEALEVSLSGRKYLRKWDIDSKQYKNDGTLTAMLKQANWNYRNQNSDSPNGADLIFIRKLTGDGTSVSIVANKLPSTTTEGKGTITIEAHGRRFDINVRVVK